MRVTTATQAVDELVRHVVSGEPATTYRLVNAYTLSLASRDPDYQRILVGPGINLPDGLPLAKVLAWTNPDVDVHRVRGPSLFEDCLDRGRTAGIRHYLLGSTEEVLDELTGEIQRRFPGTKIAGMESPPFRALSEAEKATQAGRILASRPHIVWVALGTPNQDFEALRLMRETGLTTAAVGAAFEFTAGTIAQAPVWMRRSGLEWAFRLATEPRRLWRRYLFGNATFVRLSVRHAIRTRASRAGRGRQ